MREAWLKVTPINGVCATRHIEEEEDKIAELMKAQNDLGTAQQFKGQGIEAGTKGAYLAHKYERGERWYSRQFDAASEPKRGLRVAADDKKANNGTEWFKGRSWWYMRIAKGQISEIRTFKKHRKNTTSCIEIK